MVKRCCVILILRGIRVFSLCVCVFVTGLLQLVSEKDKVIDKGLRQTETLRRGMIIESLIIICVHPV